MGDVQNISSVIVNWPLQATTPSEDELKFRFLQFGTIVSVKSDEIGKAIVTFLQPGAAAASVNKMNGQFFNGYPVEVQLNMPNPQTEDEKTNLQVLTDCRFYCRLDCAYRHFNPSSSKAWKNKKCKNRHYKELHPNHDKAFDVGQSETTKPSCPPSTEYACSGRCPDKQCPFKTYSLDELLGHIASKSNQMHHITSSPYIFSTAPVMSVGQMPTNPLFHSIHNSPAMNLRAASLNYHTSVANAAMHPNALASMPVARFEDLNIIDNIPNKDLEPIAIFWDIENCQVPNGKSASAVANRIRDIYLPGRREIDFTCVCDTTKAKPDVINALNDAQVNILHINSTAKNAADDKIRQSLRRFAKEFSPPANALLISSDVNFVNDLSDLRYRHGFRVMLLHNSQASKALISSAHEARRFDIVMQDVDVWNPQPRIQAPAFVLVSKLPQNLNERRAKSELERLSNNCGGKCVAFARHVQYCEALLKFSNEESANKCQTRLLHETIDNCPIISTSVINDVDNIPRDMIFISSSSISMNHIQNNMTQSVDYLFTKKDEHPKNNITQSMACLNSGRVRSNSSNIADHESLQNKSKSKNGLVTLTLSNLNNSTPSNLLSRVTKKEMGKLYTVEHFKITNYNKGTAEITFKTNDNAAKCIQKVNKIDTIFGRNIRAHTNSSCKNDNVDSPVQSKNDSSLSSAALSLIGESVLKHLGLNILQNQLLKKHGRLFSNIEIEALKELVFIGGKPGRMITCLRSLDPSTIFIEEDSETIKSNLIDALKQEGCAVPLVSVPAIYWSYSSSRLIAKSGGTPILQFLQDRRFCLHLNNKGRMLVGLQGNDNISMTKLLLMIQSSPYLAIPLSSISVLCEDMFGHALTIKSIIQLQTFAPNTIKISTSEDDVQVLMLSDSYKLKILEQNLELILKSKTTIEMKEMHATYCTFFGKPLLLGVYGFSSLKKMLKSLPPRFQVTNNNDKKELSLCSTFFASLAPVTIEAKRSTSKEHAQLSRDVNALLSSLPSCQTMLCHFQADFAERYSCQLCVTDYGFNSLQGLLESLGLNLKFTGQGSEKYVTLIKDGTLQFNRKQLTKNIETMLMNLPSHTALMRMFSQMYVSQYNSQLCNADYGCSSLQELLQSLNLNLQFTGEGNNKFVTLMKHQETSRSSFSDSQTGDIWTKVDYILRNQRHGALPLQNDVVPHFMYQYLNNKNVMKTAPAHIQVLGKPDSYYLILLPCKAALQETCCIVLSSFLYQKPQLSESLSRCHGLTELKDPLQALGMKLIEIITKNTDRFEVYGDVVTLTLDHARTLAIDKIVDLLQEGNNLEMSIDQIVPNYHKKYGYQLVLRLFGFQKLKDLLNWSGDLRLQVTSEVIKLGTMSKFESKIVTALKDSHSCLAVSKISTVLSNNFKRTLKSSLSNDDGELDYVDLIMRCKRHFSLIGKGDTSIIVLKGAVKSAAGPASGSIPVFPQSLAISHGPSRGNFRGRERRCRNDNCFGKLLPEHPE